SPHSYYVFIISDYFNPTYPFFFPTRRSSDLISNCLSLFEPNQPARPGAIPKCLLFTYKPPTDPGPPFKYLYVHQKAKSTSHSLRDRKSTRLNSSHVSISYDVFFLIRKK